jgi:DNA-3-methyladenine glycosylase
MSSLGTDFYARPVLEVAPDLIGCKVEHAGIAGVIVETEAYHQCEPACHAFVGRTPRTETLFGQPGRAYVYRSYGVHALLNAVCEREGVGAAVLIRALVPVAGIDAMRARRTSSRPADGMPRQQDLCSGPGKLTRALGIELAENGSCLEHGPIRISPRAGDWREPSLLQDTRVGISRATELRWRFCAAGNRHVSSPRPDRRRAARPRGKARL